MSRNEKHSIKFEASINNVLKLFRSGAPCKVGCAARQVMLMMRIFYRTNITRGYHFYTKFTKLEHFDYAKLWLRIKN